MGWWRPGSVRPAWLRPPCWRTGWLRAAWLRAGRMGGQGMRFVATAADGWKRACRRIGSPGRQAGEWLRATFRRTLWPAPLSLGQRGEQATARYLRRRGWTIVARGRSERFGELDIVAIERRTVVFVEVKTRGSHRGGHPAEAVDPVKQRRIVLSALAYLKRHRLLECQYRFDIVAVTWPEGQRRPTIEHFRNAFEPPGPGDMFG
jgi:putative endonuclease